MPVYEYRCDLGHVQEAIRPMNVTSVRCACGHRAERSGVHRVAIHGLVWDERAAMREGGPVRAPAAWKAAKARTMQATLPQGEE